MPEHNTSDTEQRHVDNISMMVNLWYDARQEEAQSMMRPSRANAPTSLNSVPDEAVIYFDTGEEVTIRQKYFQNKETPRFFIERAMFDGEATVEPLEGQ